MKTGTFDLPYVIAVDPMEDVTDLPCRVICKRLEADIVYTEFVNDRLQAFLEMARDVNLQTEGVEG
ncbi:MAG: tRNA-dihydrouridine synthase [Bacteroidota bacterium]